MRSIPRSGLVQTCFLPEGELSACGIDSLRVSRSSETYPRLVVALICSPNSP